MKTLINKSYFMNYSLVILVFIFLLVVPDLFAENAVKNIIIMISDGCGYNQIDATSMYQYGKTGTQIYENFPVKVAMTTYSAGNFNDDGTWKYRGSYDPKLAWSWFDYVKSGATDSAAAATAMSTGVKTYDSGIGVNPDKKPLKHLSTRVKESGKAIGVITSVQFSHATPASFISHNVSRSNYEEIAIEMILDSKADVIMGCGNPLFDNNAKLASEKNYKYVGGEAVWNGLLKGDIDFDLNGDGIVDNAVEDIDNDGEPDVWTLIQDVSEFRALMNGITPKRVIGVPKVFETLQYKRDTRLGSDYTSKDEKMPYETPLNQNVPTLVEMTRSALNILDNDPDGFFLMIEGGAVDWACHGNSSARLIEEEIDFNKSVASVVEWIENNSSWDETLLIVTGDHETGYLTGPGSGPSPDNPDDDILPVWNPLVNNGAGNLPGMEWHSDGHTNSLIPLFAKGIGSNLFLNRLCGKDHVRGDYIDNTDIAKVCFELFDMPGTDYSNVLLLKNQKKLNHSINPCKAEGEM